MNEPKIVYVSKYAASGRIDVCEVVSDTSPYLHLRGPKWTAYIHKKYCFDNKEGAIQDGKDIIKARIRSLKKQIENLEAMELTAD